MTNDEAINRIRLAINELRRSSGNRRDSTTAEQSIRMLETVVEALQKHPLGARLRIEVQSFKERSSGPKLGVKIAKYPSRF